MTVLYMETRAKIWIVERESLLANAIAQLCSEQGTVESEIVTPEKLNEKISQAAETVQKSQVIIVRHELRNRLQPALAKNKAIGKIILGGAVIDDKNTRTKSCALPIYRKPFASLLSNFIEQLQQYAGSSTQPSSDSRILLGSWQFIPSQRLITRIEPSELGKSPHAKDSAQIKLTEKESELLHYLFLKNGDYTKRSDILRELWAYQEGVTSHTLDQHIYRLRQKISATELQKQLILDRLNESYRLVINLYSNS